MWIVRIALDRPYTFVVLSLLVLILSPLVILRTPTDIFPNINIPVIAVVWTYTGLNAEEMEGRLTSSYERSLTTLVDNIQHIESTSYNGIALVKIFLQPGASLDTANAQVTAASQLLLRQAPPGTEPPEILNYSASNVPILQLGLSGDNLSEQQLNDLGLNFLRTQLVTVPGATIPYPYGGKQRQVTIAFNPARLQAKGLSPTDVLNAVNAQDLVLPSGTAKISQFEYDVRTNAAPRTIEQLNDLPIRTVGGATIYLRDVATVNDGFAPQTNIVRLNGQRGVLVTVLKAGNASTINVVDDIRALLPRVEQTMPPQLHIRAIGDQSIFVKAAVSDVVREAVIAACLTALMILLFLGSWRSTLIIAVSIPLSILTSVMVLSALGETINIMTLGGLALAVGILVDDATVTIENMERYLEDGQPLREAILNGASQIAVPALVSTLCICIVFVPMFLLQGVARYLFMPLAEAVVFAMLASYFLSRTLVPTMAMYLLRRKPHGPARSHNPLAVFQRGFERGFERTRYAYRELLTLLVRRRRVFIPGFLACCLALFALGPWLGQDFFPNTDSGQFILHLRAKTGTRIEETARLADQVETAMRRVIPARELDAIVDNIGLPYSGMNLTHTATGVLGAADADIMVSLKPDHHPTASYLTAIRRMVAQEFPGVTFYSLPADMITQILNFGMPSPIDIEIDGANVRDNRVVADQNSRRGASSAGRGGCTHPAALRLPGLRHRRRPHQGAAERTDRARRRGQPTGNAKRQLPDRADVLPQLEERGELSGCSADATIRHPVSARHPEHPDHWLVGQPGDPRRCRHDLPLAGDGGGGSLQHPTRRRCLRQCARARPWRGGAAHPAHRCGQQRPPAAWQLRDHPRPARNHARRLYQLGRRAGLLDPARLSTDRCELPVLA